MISRVLVLPSRCSEPRLRRPREPEHAPFIPPAQVDRERAIGGSVRLRPDRAVTLVLDLRRTSMPITIPEPGIIDAPGDRVGAFRQPRWHRNHLAGA